MNGSEFGSPMKRKREIFSKARLIPAGTAREAYLDEACGDDATLREEIVALLAAEEKAGDFLNHDAMGNAVRQPEDLLGKVIGHYRVVEHIGEGGFGDVYRVEQRDPIHRELAMKIVKPGMGSREIETRFRSEREALALMEHPNIAHILDAGTTEDGRLFFVMDLVEGVPITHYCDEQMLSLSERLNLFKTVCEAVQHAHQKGILHRDLKPSNIVVTELDGKPVPKIIDFGIAKALKGELKDRTLMTQVGLFVGTPAYMSPEQVTMSSEALDTRADIYSLGVLLYELLAGVQPFEQDTLQRAALAEIQRIICEEDPEKPSTRLLRIGERARTIAHKRRSEAATLVRTIKGDLDWIVMKAIEKDRTRRYQGVGELARDIERHLHNEPVEAGAPSRIYRLRKFIRRHRTGSTLVSAIVPLFCIGFVTTIIGFIQASQNQEQAQINELVAQAEAVKASTFREHLLTLLVGDLERRHYFLSLDAAFGQERNNPIHSARDIIDKLEELEFKSYQLLTDYPEKHAYILGLLADSYLSLELKLQAWELYEKVIEIVRTNQGPESIALADELVRYAQSINYGYYATITMDGSGYPELFDWALTHAGRKKEIALLDEALGIFRKNDHLDDTVVAALIQRAGASEKPGDVDETLLRELAEIGRKLYGVDDFRSVICEKPLAIYLTREGRLEEAKAIWLRLEAAYAREDFGYYWLPITGTSGLGMVKEMEGDFDGAEDIYRESLRQIEQYFRGEFSHAYINNLKMLNRILHQHGKSDDEVTAKLALIGYRRGFDPTNCRVDYKLRITQPGTYRLYLKFNGHNHFSDSISARIRELKDGFGGEIADFYGLTKLGFYNRRKNFPNRTFDIEWDSTGYFEHPFGVAYYKNRFPVEWTITEPGDYTLEFMETESGVALDRFVFQLNTLPEPPSNELEPSIMDANGVYTMIDGAIVVEAEDFSKRFPGQVTDWLVVPDEHEPIENFKAISGRGYLQILPEKEWLGRPQPP
ncbi:MAG TPA: serine/threonine-protein kinase [Oceanipulchritudo sp.]|nr:serine/threonine-protein kinase [Oceanipulchritudo sp.]